LHIMILMLYKIVLFIKASTEEAIENSLLRTLI